jgi:hypothetical protein
MFSAPITRDTLQGLARAAAAEFLTNRTPLTDAVVKQASAYGADLTSEHVRRICEMTYHDVYERLHRQGSGADRYVSFDPPNAEKAASRLNAQKVASAVRGTVSSSGGLMTEKSASAPQGRVRFQPANAFTELMNEAPTQEAPDDLVRQLRELHQNIKEASLELSAEAHALKAAEQASWLETLDLAYGLAKEGASLDDLLRAGLSGVDWEATSTETATEVASKLASFLMDKEARTVGFRMSKTASEGEVDTDHPFPRAFAKSAGMADRRIQVTLALSDINADLARVNEALLETFADQKVASYGNAFRAAGNLGKKLGQLIHANPKASAGIVATALVGAGAANELRKRHSARSLS